jgi:serpin B
MLILMPKAIDGLDKLETQVANGEIDKWISGLKSTKVEVALPKFRITSEFSLKDVLTSMGMSLAFSSEANFSRMSSQGQLSIDAVVHKAFVDVNE